MTQSTTEKLAGQLLSDRLSEITRQYNRVFDIPVVKDAYGDLTECQTPDSETLVADLLEFARTLPRDFKPLIAELLAFANALSRANNRT